jgi:hypothetical protein
MHRVIVFAVTDSRNALSKISRERSYAILQQAQPRLIKVMKRPKEFSRPEREQKKL